MADLPQGELTELKASSALAVIVEPEGLLVAGSEEAVESYLDTLRHNAVDAMQIAGVDLESATGAAALASGLAAMSAQHGTFVRIAPESVKLMQKFRVIPGKPGFNRMMVADTSGKFRGQLQWQHASLAGTRALSLQLTIAAIALQTAIGETTRAVERVEGKVDAILNLVQATLIGDVVGHQRSLQRTVRTLDETGALPVADWESVAHLGPTLEVGVERLRAHIRKTLEGFDASAPVQTRAKYLQRAVHDNHLGESLGLLVVAQQSLYLWQRLRLERVRQSEPEHLGVVIRSSRELLADNLAADGVLLLKARSELATYAAIKPLEIVRWMSNAQLKRDIVQLRDDLDGFAVARRSQVQGWQDHEDPSINDALAVLGSHFKAVGGSALAIGSKGVDAGAAGLGFLSRNVQSLVGRRRSTSGEGDSSSDESGAHPAGPR